MWGDGSAAGRRAGPALLQDTWSPVTERLLEERRPQEEERTMTRTCSIAIAVGLLLITAAPAAAMPALDQEHVLPSFGVSMIIRDTTPKPFGGFMDRVSVSQTFTAGASGQLSGVDLAVFTFETTVAPLDVVIFPTKLDDGVYRPDDSLPPLAAVSVPAEVVPLQDGTNTQMWHVDLSAAGALVAEGTVYAIVVSSAATGWNTYNWPFSRKITTGVEYETGTACYSRDDVNNAAWTVVYEGESDFFFRTYVDENPSPPDVLDVIEIIEGEIPPLPGSSSNALTNQLVQAIGKLEKADEALAEGKLNKARNFFCQARGKLDAFIGEVSLRSPGQIDPATAADLIALAEQVQALIDVRVAEEGLDACTP